MKKRKKRKKEDIKDYSFPVRRVAWNCRRIVFLEALRGKESLWV